MYLEREKSVTLLSFFFNDTATTEIYTLSLHDALPISGPEGIPRRQPGSGVAAPGGRRSEEHTSELQSLAYLVCRLLLEKKKHILLLVPLVVMVIRLVQELRVL